jgi:hypothetical protein
MTTTISVEEKEAARKASRAKAERDRRAKLKAGKATVAEVKPVVAKASEMEAKLRRGRVPSDPVESYDEKDRALAALAVRLAPRVVVHPRTIGPMKQIVGRSDPVAFAFDGVPKDAEAADDVVGGRDARAVLLSWARSELESSDPAARRIRATVQRVRGDERAPLVGGKSDLWGRKVAAILVALADSK